MESSRQDTHKPDHSGPIGDQPIQSQQEQSNQRLIQLPSPLPWFFYLDLQEQIRLEQSQQKEFDPEQDAARQMRPGYPISWPVQAIQDQQEQYNRRNILHGLRDIWQLKQNQHERYGPNQMHVEMSELDILQRSPTLQIINSTWPVGPFQHMPQRVLIRQLLPVEHLLEPEKIPKLFHLALDVFSTISPLHSSDPLRAMSSNNQEIEYICDVIQPCFDDMYEHVPLFSMYLLYKNVPHFSQLKQHFLRKRHLTIYLYSGKKPSDWNEGHLFLGEDLKKYDRDYGNKYKYIDVKLMNEAIAFFKDLGSLCLNLISLTVIFEDSEQQLDPALLSQLFEHMPLTRLEQFSFIRSTKLDVYSDRELESLTLLYNQFDHHFTKEKMPQLRKLNIWLSHEYSSDLHFVPLLNDYCVDFQSIVPQLEHLTFVGPCTDKQKFLAQLETATKLTHLTLDVSRAFNLPPTRYGQLVQPVNIKKHYQDQLPESVLERETHLRLYRADIKNPAHNPTELIKLFTNLESLQVYTIQYNGYEIDYNNVQYFPVVSVPRLTELRLHNFQINSLLNRTARYPAVRKLTLCSAKINFVSSETGHYFWDISQRQLLVIFFRQFPNLRELVIFTEQQCASMNQQFFDTIQRTCVHLESVHICENAFELANVDAYDLHIRNIENDDNDDNVDNYDDDDVDEWIQELNYR